MTARENKRQHQTKYKERGRAEEDRTDRLGEKKTKTQAENMQARARARTHPTCTQHRKAHETQNIRREHAPPERRTRRIKLQNIGN